MTWPPRTVGGKRRVETAAQVANHLLQPPHPSPSGRAPHHQVAEAGEGARDVLPVAVPAAQHRQAATEALSGVGVSHHQQLVVEKGVHVGPPPVVQVEHHLLVDVAPPHQPVQDPDEPACQRRTETQAEAVSH